MPVSVETIVETLNRHRVSLIAYAWVVVGDAQLADDIYQDISLVAIRKADQITDDQHLLPWLRKAARLRGIELRRNLGRQNLLEPHVLDLFEHTPGQAAHAKDSDRMASLRRCIESLPSRSRELLALRYEHDMKPARIAEHTGKSDQAIYKAIKRIHLLLADCVKERLKALGVSS